MICGEQTRGYGGIGVSLLQMLQEIPSASPAAPALSKYLANEEDSDWWPDDLTFQTNWCTRRFYGGLRRQRVSMILESLEEFYHRKGTKTEPIVQFDFATLEIEHILPQEWKAHWPLPTSDPDGVTRQSKLHNIGNLTLVSGKLNPSLSHAAWLDGVYKGKPKQGKRSALEEHSKLQLNAKLIKEHRRKWNEATIDQRALELFEVARIIWPRPS
jgi:hypothetical protein